MTKQARGALSANLAQALSRLSAQGQTIFTTEDFVKASGASPQEAWTALNFLVQGGWAIRLVKGTYLIVPLEAGPQSTWTGDSLVIACNIIHPAAAAYWTACNHWNWTEQFPRTVFVQSTSRPQPHKRSILGVNYRLIRVSPKKFFGVIERAAGQARFSITDREKTFVDALDRPDLCGGIRQVLEMLPEAEVDWDKVETYMEKMGSGAIYKRLGWLVEFLGQKLSIPKRERRLSEWRSRLTGGYAPLEPGSRLPGPVDNRWLLRVNVPALAGGKEQR